MAFDIDALSAAQIAAGVAAGDFSAREDDVHAFLEVSSELALQAADAIDAKRAAGEQLPPMAGVPCAFKDNMHLVGTRCTCASRMLENYQSTFTATAVQRMLDAGCIPVGKTNMDEFAFGSSTESSAFGPTCNPRDLGCLPPSPQV